MTDDTTEPERPRAEPEIIPPDRSRGTSDWDRPAWRSQDSAWTGGPQRIYVGRLGPFGFAVLMLVFAVVIAVMFLAIIGAALIWIPFVVSAVLVVGIYRHLRR